MPAKCGFLGRINYCCSTSRCLFVNLSSLGLLTATFISAVGQEGKPLLRQTSINLLTSVNVSPRKKNEKDRKPKTKLKIELAPLKTCHVLCHLPPASCLKTAAPLPPPPGTSVFCHHHHPTFTVIMSHPRTHSSSESVRLLPFSTGVWTPKSQTPHGSSNDLLDLGCSSAAPTPPPPPTVPVWTPQPSPALSGRKEFRPVRFESPTLPRRYTAQQQQQQQQEKHTTTIPPWSYTNGSCPASAPVPAPPRSTTTNQSTPTTLNSTTSDYAETDCSAHFGPVAPSASVSDKIKSTAP